MIILCSRYRLAITATYQRENDMDTVKIWEENLEIPTYEIGEADINPMFLEKRVY